MKVCLSGSRGVLRLPPRAIEELETMMSLDVEIEVGDEPSGVDNLFQRHLAERKYTRVRVWHTGTAPRVNLGNWPTVQVRGSFTERDRRMCAASDYGVSVWDGRSPGTARNARQLGRRMRTIRLG